MYFDFSMKRKNQRKEKKIHFLIHIYKTICDDIT